MSAHFAPAPAFAQNITFSGSPTSGTFDVGDDGTPDGTWTFTATGASIQTPTFIPNGISYEFESSGKWSLDSRFSATGTTPGFTYSMVVYGNNGSGKGFGAKFSDYILTWTAPRPR